MKRFVSLLLAVLMIVGCLAACGDKTETPSANTPNAEVEVEAGNTTEKMIVGVVMMSASDTMMEMQTYLETVVGPLFNMEFIFSEVIGDAGAMTTFIENAKASGAQGIINTLSNMCEQSTDTCENLGLWCISNTSTYYETVAELSHHVGVIGASPAANGDAFASAMHSALEGTEVKGVLVLSGAACYGAISQIEATVAMLETVSELYGTTYTEDITKLATVNATTDVETGNAVKVTVHPGVPQGADYASAVSSLLQTGEYDVVCSAFDAYGAISVAIDEVEKNLSMNIKVISQMAVNDTALANLKATDSTGDNCINAGVTAGNTTACAVAALLLRNAFDGHSETLRPEGKAYQLVTAPLAISSAADMENLMKVPVSYMTEDELKSLVISFNADCTMADYEKVLASLTTENILAKFN